MGLLTPLIVNEVLNELNRPSLYDQHFGMPLSILPAEPYSLLSSPLRSGYLRPWRNLDLENSGLSTVSNDKDGFRINLDVQQFKPDELSVKVANDFLVIDGKHEERSDEHGYVSRQFTRRYKIPSGVNVDDLSSTLTSDGVLQLHAPKLAVEKDNERTIPITQSNQPAIKRNSEPKSIKQNTESQATTQNSEPQKTN